MFESKGERRSFADVRDAEIEADTIYQIQNLGDYPEEQKATF
jgi:hypothetical protein